MSKTLLGPVIVHGRPAPFATSGELGWKEAVAKQIAASWGTRPHIEFPCEVKLRFRLPRVKAEATDLDNLLKPTIDAIGSVLFKPARAGHQTRWNTDDHWIYRFVAEKTSEDAHGDVGVEITVGIYETSR